VTDLLTEPTGPAPVIHAVGEARWRPTRAGLVNLWRYWDETFTFHAGRLLLRGANGSGKSMALELLLPFLLDADASPHRLTSAAKSRGGLYERVMTGTTDTSRAGFAWVEFERGADQVFTVGVRIQASANTHKADPSFFTTTQRIGTDLHLLDDHRVPVTRKVLGERIGSCGRVHNSRDEHRAAVREGLYAGFSPDRFDSVITALLALRKEKLSQNLDVAKLSDVLSDALPPLDEHDLAAVAEGFERLDRRRAELTSLEGELERVRALSRRNRDYARAVLASVSGEVRSAETRRDGVTRDEREAGESLSAARAEAQALADEMSALDTRLVELDAKIDALKSSEAYKSGAALNDLRRELKRLGEAVERDRAAWERAKRLHGGAVSDEERARAAQEVAAGNHDRAVTELRSIAVSVAADAVVEEAIDSGDGDQGEALVRAWARDRRVRIAEMRAAVRAHESSIERRSFDEARRDAEQEILDAHVLAHRQAVADHARTVDLYVAAVRSWSASSVIVGPERIAQALPTPPEDPAGVEKELARLSAELQAEHGRAREVLGGERDTVEAERAILEAERADLAGGRIIEPPAPPWRSDRGSARGAPLWRLVDVAPTARPEDIEGVEGALVASGLADAWVHPDGGVDLPDDRADLVLTARSRSGASLSDLLVAIDDTPVPAEITAAVLASIPIAPTVTTLDGDGVVIGVDGTFRLGPARGRGPCGPARLLGAEAQERRRQERLAELDSLLAQADTRLADIDVRVIAVDRREAAALAELAAAPDGGGVRDAEGRVATADVRLVEARRRVAEARQALERAEIAVRDAVRSLTLLATRNQLPTTADALDEVAAAVDTAERSAAAWAHRLRDLSRAEAARQQAAGAVAEAESGLSEREAALTITTRDRDDVKGRLDELESTIGDDHRETLRRLAALEGEQRNGQRRVRELAASRPDVERRIGRLEQAVADAEQARRDADDTRAAAHQRFTAALADGLGADAGVAEPPAPLDGITAVLTAARTIGSELEKVAGDLASVDRSSNRVQEELHHARAALGGRIDVTFEHAAGGWWLLRGAVSGLRRRIGELADALAGELDQGRAELAADEERLFEQTLAGTVRQALAERIRRANALVDGINDQLAAVRTRAGGVQVRLRWEVDPEQPAVVSAARSLLLRDPADLADEERISLQDFVRARVDQARAELEANAPWEARLRETLDYRAWHRFSLMLGHRDWQGLEKATPQRLQRLSTGERSIALHLPMLASLAAHYTAEAGQRAACPRLILLDELFAGVDPANRAQLFGTFTAWDLDAVFTSDHEWCQYATLDGIAIHHLHASDGDDPVTSTRFTWDGKARRIDPEEV
jgi:uncharacterized protein (TIGR02680 family)